MTTTNDPKVIPIPVVQKVDPNTPKKSSAVRAKEAREKVKK